jgi:2-phospho-L-lactate guanylyltransferase (CobY/MobA/RfbA family)
MNKEDARKRVEELKKLLEDYTRLAPLLDIDKESKKRTIDIMLDDLSRALKELEN